MVGSCYARRCATHALASGLRARADCRICSQIVGCMPPESGMTEARERREGVLARATESVPGPDGLQHRAGSVRAEATSRPLVSGDRDQGADKTA